jgi:hypothetical protein
VTPHILDTENAIKWFMKNSVTRRQKAQHSIRILHSTHKDMLSPCNDSELCNHDLFLAGGVEGGLPHLYT